ncbi:PIG-L deacetylase family protein [Desulfovibrio cuneatus]|uniref:PIG-L deacetylase family protein n=1 Tax=Desulfovibrio cuneatus TaxID=159728 RepID=UPI00055119E6|nr:PIG-L deacetylase family protein [Desulfovibrio cuneatus]
MHTSNLQLFPKQLLVIAAHPDDEMLGCGGTLARMRASGAEVSILLLGEGPTSRESNEQEVAAAQTASSTSALAAAAALGISDVRFAALPDNRFDTIALLDIVKAIESITHDLSPDLIFTHHVGDLNIDHVLTHNAVMTAFRPLPGIQPITILSFEVLSSTEYAPPGMRTTFHPTVYVNIESFLDAKQNALQAYASEMRPWPHPRSFEAVEHLARFRGSQCGYTAAEAFVLCRSIF